MLKIGEFSKLCKTTIKTLRYYDEIDLIKPFFVDENGYRYYDISQLNDLILIVELRKLDMPIADIKAVLFNKDISKILEKHLLQLQNEIVKKHKQISLIKKYIKKCKGGKVVKKYEAKEIVVPKNIVYFKHGVIASMNDLFNFVLSAGEEAKQYNKNLECINYCYVTYTANEYKETDVELEYVEAVKQFGNESENIKFREDPEILAVSVKHKGKYEDLKMAYAFALNTVKEKGYKIAGPIREVYIDGCWNKQNEEDYLTEIQIPVSK